MTATGRWNVRVVDYLIERGADPFVKDKFGFTAQRKAEIKNLRTISSMLKQYENEYQTKTHKSQIITNTQWL